MNPDEGRLPAPGSSGGCQGENRTLRKPSPAFHALVSAGESAAHRGRGISLRPDRFRQRPRLGRHLSLEHRPGRVFHRPHLRASGKPRGYLRSAYAHGHSYRQAGERGHVSGAQAQRKLPGRAGQSAAIAIGSDSALTFGPSPMCEPATLLWPC
jgi:hypothetical protein